MGDHGGEASAASAASAGANVQELAAGAAECAGLAAAAAAAESSTTTAAQTLSTRADLIEFDLAATVIYHRAREAWFTGLKRGTMFATILLGAASVAPFMPTVLTGPLVALMGALNLSFDFAGQALRHAELRASYLAIVTELQGAGFIPEACAVARRKMLELAAKEPPAYCTVALAARNQAILSLGRDRREIETIGCKRSLTRHLWRAEGL